MVVQSSRSEKGGCAPDKGESHNSLGRSVPAYWGGKSFPFVGFRKNNEF